MSSSNSKWQLGVAHVAERLDSFNRWTKFGESYNAVPTYVSQHTMAYDVNNSTGWSEYSASSSLAELDLDDDICTDYAESPYFLSGTISDASGNIVNGNQIFLGPSSDADYDGAVERPTIHQVKVDGGAVNVVRLSFAKSGSYTHISWPTAAYSDGDPVLIRTIPHGWTTYSDFSSLKMVVRPAYRYDERASLAWLEDPGAGAFPDITNRERRTGVELCVTETTGGGVAVASDNRYIQFVSNVNTFLPWIRKWRISWDYRLGRANYSSNPNASQCSAKIIAALAAADGSLLFPIKDGTGVGEGGPTDATLDDSGINKINREIKTYSATDIVADWTEDSAYATYDYNSPDDPEFDLGASSVNPSYKAFNRGNRWVIRIILSAGINTALGLDNVIIEHAHGTSDETNGYYEIEDWPNFETISFSQISTERGNQRLENGALKVGYRENIRRWSLSADFENVDVGIYRDMLILLEWQKKGYPLVLRPYGTPLPTPLIGKMTIDKWRTQHWNVENRVSFTLSFEEI